MRVSLVRLFRPGFLLWFFLAWVAVFTIGGVLTGPKPLRSATPLANFFFSGAFAVSAVMLASPLFSPRARALMLMPQISLEDARRRLLTLSLVLGAFSLGTIFQGMRLWAP